MPAPTLSRVSYEARRARDAGMHVMLLGIGLEASALDPNTVVSKPHEHNIFTVHDFNSLQTVRKQILDELCKGIQPVLVNREIQWYPRNSNAYFSTSLCFQLKSALFFQILKVDVPLVV